MLGTIQDRDPATRALHGLMAPVKRTEGQVDHAVYFYSDEAKLRDVVVQHLVPAFSSHEPVLIVATPAHARAFVAALFAQGCDVHTARSTGQLKVLDAESTLAPLMVDGMPDRERFQRVVGGALEAAMCAGRGKHAHAYGEMVDLLWRAGNRKAAVRLEELWNELGALCSFSLLCAYSLDARSKEPDMHSVCGTHSRVLAAARILPEPRQEAGLTLDHARMLIAEIEHRKEVEEALRDSVRVLHENQQQLERALQTKDDFLAMVGHELRNPLAPIVSALELMNLRLGDKGVEERRMVERHVRLLTRVVDDLLDVSRITHGKVELERKPVDMAQVIAEAREVAGPAIEEKHHRFETHLGEDLRVDGDEHRLTQVVTNLLINAARYTDPGGTISLSARCEASHVVVRVRDTGIGISRDFLPQLFNFFVQGERSACQGGLGLGLAIVKNLVAMHGGVVGAHSDGIGKGSEFSFRLPMLSPATLAAGTRVTANACFTPSTSRRKLLLVDDNESLVKILRELLDGCGYEVHCVTDGARALELAADLMPDAALIDISMPVMSGYEVARRLKEITGLSGIKVIATSGYSQPRDQARAREAGFDAYLVKPVRIDELIRALGDGQPEACEPA